MLDKKGTFLEKNQSVSVPKPNETDMHNFAFSGTIIDVLESRGTVIVEDQCGDVFEVEADRVDVED